MTPEQETTLLESMTPEIDELKTEFVREVAKASARSACSDYAFMEFLRAEYSDNGFAELTGNDMALSMLHQCWRAALKHARKQ